MPHLAGDGPSLAVVDVLFDSLTAHGPNGEVVPAAATSWRASADLREWTFALRRGALFHDGAPVTATAFKRAWEQAVREGVAGHHLRMVEGYAELRGGPGELVGVTAIDPLTLRVVLSSPLADFPAVAAHPALGPWPSGFVADDPAARAAPVGNGPFRMAEAWARGRFIRTTRFAEYANGQPQPVRPGADPLPGSGHGLRPWVTELLFLVRDADAGYVAFQQGRVDVATIPQGALAQAVEDYGRPAEGSRGPGVLTAPAPVLYLLGMDHTAPPFDNRDVRRALSLAIDRSALAAAQLEGNLEPALRAVPRGVVGAPVVSCRDCPGDKDAARDLFAEHGVTSLRLTYNTGGGHEPVAEAIRHDLAAVGVALELEPVDGSEYLGRLRGGGIQLFRFGWAADYPTLDNALYGLLHSADPAGEGTGNLGRYADPRVDDLLDEARATADADRRRRLYLEAEALAVGVEQALIPLFTYRHRVVVGERVRNLRLSSMGTFDPVPVRLEPARAERGT